MTDKEIENVLRGDFDIEIPAFEKWNPPMQKKGRRRDWFKMSVDWVDDPKIARLSDFQIRLWLCLVTFRARSESAWTGVRLVSVSSRMRFRGGPALVRALCKLLEFGLIRLRQLPPERRGEDKIREEIATVLVVPSKHPPALAPRDAPHKKKIDGREVAELIACYCEAFKTRYGTNPHVDGKTAGLVRRLLGDVSVDRAKMLIQAYLQMEDPWFLKKCHDFGTFMMNLSPVVVALANGTQDPQEKRFWSQVFRGSEDERKSLQSGD